MDTVSRYINTALRQDWRTPSAMYSVLVPPLWDVSDRHDGTFDALTGEWPDGWYCNPPYCRGIEKWTARMAGNGIALLPVRTDTRWFHADLLGKATLFFIKGRLKYDDVSINAPFASMLAVFGTELLTLAEKVVFA